MTGRFFKHIPCRRITPLLVPFSENMLEEGRRARVLSHLDRCESCREELAAIAAMGDFFRANPPAAAAPPADLWARLESQIMAETQPVTTPIRRPTPTLANQWQSFARSFTQSGVVVAAVVVCGLFVLGRFVGHPRAASDTPVASNDGIRVMLHRSRVGNTMKPAERKVASAEVFKRKPSVFGTVVVMPRSERRVVAHNVHDNVRSVRISPRKMVIETSPAAHPETRMVASAEEPTYYSLSYRDSDAVDPLKVNSAKEPETLGVVDAMTSEGPAKVAAGVVSMAPTHGEVFYASAVRSGRELGREPIRTASWMSDESEGVPADAAGETGTAIYRQQTLFSYGGR